MRSIINFSAGPSMLPVEVMKQAQKEFLSWNDYGFSVMEYSHRSKEFMALFERLKSNISLLLNVPDGYEVLFMQGGARLQFGVLAQNLLSARDKALYLTSGYWSQMAASEASIFGSVDTKSLLADDLSFLGDIQDYKYVHYCPNETLTGLAIESPLRLAVPVIADMTSCIFSKQIDVADYDLLYASSQKNIGATGFCLVVASKQLLEQTKDNKIASVLDYKKVMQYDSMISTPATYSLYLADLVVSWYLEQGGLPYFEQLNKDKAKLLYDAIDGSAIFNNNVELANRSKVNVVFTSGCDATDTRFLQAAVADGLYGLKGHRSVGGLRASMYNAMPLSHVQLLADFIAAFK